VAIFLIAFQAVWLPGVYGVIYIAAEEGLFGPAKVAPEFSNGWIAATGSVVSMAIAILTFFGKSSPGSNTLGSALEKIKGTAE
jgi:hypothetical protein